MSAPIFSIRDDLKHEPAECRKECSDLQRKLDSLSLTQLETTVSVGLLFKLLRSWL